MNLTYIDRLRSLVAAAIVTAAAAWIVFAGAPAVWELLEIYAPTIDWKVMTLVILLALYFVHFYMMLPGYLRQIVDCWQNQEYKKSIITLFHTFLMPAGAALIFIPGLLLEIFSSWAERSLSAAAARVAWRSIAVLVMVWTTIYLVLLFSNLWQPAEQQCSWVFPKIMSCLLTEREDLAGGLIGAGGTIFAGWLAWAGVQERLAQQRKNSKRKR